MAQLTNGDKELLARHQIDITNAFDATSFSYKEWSPIMKRAGKEVVLELLLVGVQDIGLGVVLTTAYDATPGNSHIKPAQLRQSTPTLQPQSNSNLSKSALPETTISGRVILIQKGMGELRIGPLFTSHLSCQVTHIQLRNKRIEY